MDNLNTYNKVVQPKTIDTINLNGKYVDVTDLKTKIVKASTTSVFVVAFITFLFMLLT